MGWRTAFTNLAAIAVTGVATSYDLDDLPNALAAADLPALAPSFPQEWHTSDDEGLSTLTYDGGVWRASLQVEHVLYWTPAWSEAGLSAVLPDLIDAVDNYLAAISADGALNGALDRELTIRRALPGVVEYAGVQYYGARFVHEWMITI